MTTFTTDQICKLREMERARMKRGGPGFHDAVQRLICQLDSGGAAAATSKNERVRQAKVLWDIGWGTAVHSSFDEYLATIPEVPEFPKSYQERFPELVLVDERCPDELPFYGSPWGNGEFVHASRNERVYWIRAQARREVVRGKRHFVDFAEDEIELTALEGLSLFVLRSVIFLGRCTVFTGSEARDNSNYVASITAFDGVRFGMTPLRGGQGTVRLATRGM